MTSIRDILFPNPVRALPGSRAWNIAFRTAHIGATGVLLGGHLFDVAEPRLRTMLYLAILTGVCLIFVEAYPTCRWVVEGRGVMVLIKLGLLCLIPFFWRFRVPILLAVLAIASIGSHMPRRFRHYSLVHRRVVE